jgi:VanZ family protein
MIARLEESALLAAFHRHLVRWRWVTAVGVSAAIFALSSIPIRLPPGVRHLDKLAHLAEYGLLGAAYFNAVTRGGWRMTKERAWLAFLLAAAYGASDEWHQAFVLGRTADVLDWLADTTGAALATGAAWMLARRWRTAAEGTK